MHRYTYTLYFAWFLLALGLFACAGAGYFAWMIQGDSAVRAAALQNESDDAQKQAIATRAHVLARDTEGDRAALTVISRQDPLALVDLIEAAGKTAGVSVQLSGAQPESTDPQLLALGVHPVEFVVDAKGSFPALMRALELLEALPVPASVQRLDIQHIQEAKPAGTVWSMQVYLHVLITTNLSS